MIYYFSQYRNEERLIPYIFRHYDQFVDKYFIWENNSTDNTLELLLSNPKVTVFKNKNNKDEIVYRNFKNTCYKQYKDCKWVIVADADEFLYHENIKEKLQEYEKQAITVVKTQGFQMFNEGFVNSDRQIYEVMQNGVESKLYSKSILFRQGIDINYYEGAHYCDPQGYIKYSKQEIKLLHYKVFGDDFITQMLERNERKSDNDKKYGLGIYSLDEGHPFNPRKIVDNLRLNAKKVV